MEHQPHVRVLHRHVTVAVDDVVAVNVVAAGVAAAYAAAADVVAVHVAVAQSG